MQVQMEYGMMSCKLFFEEIQASMDTHESRKIWSEIKRQVGKELTYKDRDFRKAVSQELRSEFSVSREHGILDRVCG